MIESYRYVMPLLSRVLLQPVMAGIALFGPSVGAPLQNQIMDAGP